ncbi:MAG: cytidylate kinase-like family protein [Chloroflexi bacterium]|nr:cytidylate kinase-like family protein [Chloroflexota bacterium]
MPVVTINGGFPTGSVMVGKQVAKILGIDYVDSLILMEASRKIGTPVEALASKEQARPTRLGDRVARIMVTFLERSAATGATGDPYLTPGMYDIMSKTYESMAEEPSTKARELTDKAFVDVVSEVARELAEHGNVVIIGRGGNIVLRDMPKVLHVGLVAPMETRIKWIMENDRVDRREAEVLAQQRAQGRIAFFRKFFKVDADDPLLFHMVINTGLVSVDEAAYVIADAARRRG